eukprot:1890114-Pleurochrysis_carterae.AAC.1
MDNCQACQEASADAQTCGRERGADERSRISFSAFCMLFCCWCACRRSEAGGGGLPGAFIFVAIHLVDDAGDHHVRAGGTRLDATG